MRLTFTHCFSRWSVKWEKMVPVMGQVLFFLLSDVGTVNGLLGVKAPFESPFFSVWYALYSPWSIQVFPCWFWPQKPTTPAWSILKTNSAETNWWFPLCFNILCTISSGWCNIIQKFTWCSYFSCLKWLSLFLFSPFISNIHLACSGFSLCFLCGYTYEQLCECCVCLYVRVCVCSWADWRSWAW